MHTRTTYMWLSTHAAATTSTTELSGTRCSVYGEATTRDHGAEGERACELYGGVMVVCMHLYVCQIYVERAYRGLGRFLFALAASRFSPGQGWSRSGSDLHMAGRSSGAARPASRPFLEEVRVGVVVLVARLGRREVPRRLVTVGGSPSQFVRLSGESGPWQPRQLPAQDVQLAPRWSQYSGRQDLQK